MKENTIAEVMATAAFATSEEYHPIKTTENI
jgi:hypothetical protein